MWWLLRTLVSTLVVAGLVYVLFFVDLGGRNLAAHLGDVWRSPVMAEKRSLVRDAVHKKIEDTLAQEASRLTRRDAPAGDEELSEHDRSSLDHLLTRAPPRLATPLASE